MASELGRARLLPKEVITTFAREQLGVRESPQEAPQDPKRIAKDIMSDMKRKKNHGTVKQSRIEYIIDSSYWLEGVVVPK